MMLGANCCTNFEPERAQTVDATAEDENRVTVIACCANVEVDPEDMDATGEVQDAMSANGVTMMKAGVPSGNNKAKEFTAKIPKPNGSILGLELDFMDLKRGLVGGITPNGAAQMYNTANPGMQLMPGDWLLEANGESDVQKMAGAMKGANPVELVIRRTVPFTVSLPNGSESLAAALKSAQNGKSLMIAEMHADLPATVKVYDRIMEVNGQTDSPATMLTTIKSGSPLTFVVIPAN